MKIHSISRIAARWLVIVPLAMLPFMLGIAYAQNAPEQSPRVDGANAVQRDAPWWKPYLFWESPAWQRDYNRAMGKDVGTNENKNQAAQNVPSEPVKVVGNSQQGHTQSSKGLETDESFSDQLERWYDTSDFFLVSWLRSYTGPARLELHHHPAITEDDDLDWFMIPHRFDHAGPGQGQQPNSGDQWAYDYWTHKNNAPEQMSTQPQASATLNGIGTQQAAVGEEDDATGGLARSVAALATGDYVMAETIIREDPKLLMDNVKTSVGEQPFLRYLLLSSTRENRAFILRLSLDYPDIFNAIPAEYQSYIFASKMDVIFGSAASSALRPGLERVRSVADVHLTDLQFDQTGQLQENAMYSSHIGELSSLVASVPDDSACLNQPTGADPILNGIDVMTPVAYLVGTGVDTQFVQYLINKGADINATSTIVSADGRSLVVFSPLALAVAGNNEPMVQFLINQGATAKDAIVVKDAENGAEIKRVPLVRFAAKLGYVPIARVLIANGANLSSAP